MRTPESIAEIEHRLRELSDWEQRPYIYFLVRGDDIVYVGRTVNLGSRIRNHREGAKDNDIKDFDRVLYVRLSEQESKVSGLIERCFVSTLRPEFNRRESKFSDSSISELPNWVRSWIENVRRRQPKT